MASSTVPIKFDADRIFEHVDMVVTIEETRRYRLRVAVAKAMLYVMALVLGCDIRFESKVPCRME